MRESTSEGLGSEGKADFPPSREPDEGLDPGTPGSRPEPKAVAQPTEPPRHPAICINNIIFQLKFRNVTTCSLSRKQPLP